MPYLSHDVAFPIAHFVGHLVLAGALYLAVRRGGGGQPWWAPLLVAVGLSTAVSLAAEAAQTRVPEQTAQLGDVLFGLLGTLTGVGVLMAAERARVALPALALGVTGMAALVIALVSGSIVIWDPSLPNPVDHWHAGYTISICGEVLDPLPGTPGHVHTHGGGIIHVHPADWSHSLNNATLALFFRTSGGGMTDTSISLPNGQTYSNGDTCPGGEPGEVVVAVNGEVIDNPSSYVPRRGDEIHIGFEAENGPFFLR